MNKVLLQKYHNKISGFSLVEVLLSIAVFSMFAVGLVGMYLMGQESSLLVGNRDRALFIAEQGLEAARSIRDQDFSNLVNGTFGLTISGSVWGFVPTSDTLDIYTRSITITDDDAGVKRVTATVDWQQNQQRTGQVVLSTLLSFWQAVVASGNWNVPILGDGLDLFGNTNANHIDITTTHAFTLRRTNSSIDDLFSVDISDPSNLLLDDSIALSGQLRGIIVDGDYAYVASSDNTNEIYVVDISDPSALVVVDTVNATGSANMNSFYSRGDDLFAIRNSATDDFRIYDVTLPVSVLGLGSVNLSGTQNEVYVSGNYAYVVGNRNASELYVIDISNTLFPVQVATLNLAGNSNARSVDGYGSHIFIGRDNGEVAIVNIINPLAPSLVSTYGAGGRVNDLVADSTLQHLFLATNNTLLDFQVVDVSTLGSPFLLGSYNDPGGNYNGISYHMGGDFAVVAGDANIDEVKAIIPS